MAFIDYYKIMGVDKTATQDDIRKAYRHRAKIWHPDLHPDDPKAKAKFQALNEANTVLSDPEKRAKYDKYGENWEHADQFEQAGGGFGGYGGGGFGGFDFSQFSGGAGGGFPRSSKTCSAAAWAAAGIRECASRRPTWRSRCKSTFTRHCSAAKSFCRRKTSGCA